MADLTTVAAVKQWADVKATDHDTLLSVLVSGVSAWILSRIERAILSASYTETVNGNGKQVVFLRQSPITAVSSVKVDGVTVLARAGYGQSGFTFDENCLYLEGSCFTKGRQNIVIQYVAGFSAVPADLELAAKKLCAIGYRERDRIGLSSKGLSGEQTNFIVKAMPLDVVDIIQGYQRVAPV